MGNDVLCRIRGPAPAESAAGAVRPALARPWVRGCRTVRCAAGTAGRCDDDFPVLIRDSDNGMIVEVPDAPGLADPLMTDVLSGLRHRLSEALNELSVGT